MATITCFEELQIWKMAQELGAKVYFLCNTNEKMMKDYSFKDQIKRAALSISNNIAEGFEYSNNNDFYRFLRIAKGSCGEVKNCLLFSVKINYTTPDDVNEMLEMSASLGKKTGKMMKYLRDNKIVQKAITKNNA
jgi:four helix bundle protein